MPLRQWVAALKVLLIESRGAARLSWLLLDRLHQQSACNYWPMGAWGDGPFDNDDAGDWVFEAEGADDPVMLVLETFQSVLEETPLELHTANRAVAAAAWLASGHSGSVVVTPYAPSTKPPAISEELRAAAVAALHRVLSPSSEWLELWIEAGEDRAVAATRDLLNVLDTQR